MKTIFILDTSGSMTDAQIKKGIEFITYKEIIHNRKDIAIFCWSNLDQPFPVFITDLKKLYPQATTHLVGDVYFMDEYLQMVDHVTVIE